MTSREQSERLYLLLVISLPLLAMIAYFAWVFGLRDMFAVCPPSCRGRDFSGGNLAALALRNADLRDANLSRAFLDGVDASGADFTFANLAGASLVGANLQRANLTGAALSRVDARRANFAEAVLRGARIDAADLSAADLTAADLTAVSLTHTDLRDTLISEQTRLDPKWRLVWGIINTPESVDSLAGVDLRDANLSGVVLAGFDLQGADLRNTLLNGADLTGANLALRSFSRQSWTTRRASIPSGGRSGRSSTPWIGSNSLRASISPMPGWRALTCVPPT